MIRPPRHRIVLAVLVAASSSFAAVPLQVTHAGYLMEAGDQPVTNPSVAMSFSIWDDVGSPDVSHRVWPEAPNSCNANVRNGRFAVVLGSTCAPGLTSDHVPSSGARWLELSIGGVTLTPRLVITAAPVAAVASVANLAMSLPDGAVTNKMLANPKVEVTAGTGLTGGGEISLGGSTSLALAQAGTAGSFTNANITVDVYGRVIAASNGAAQGVTQVTAGAGLTGGAITTTGTLAVDVGTTAGKIVQLDDAGKVPAALLPETNALSTVSRGATLEGNGTPASPLAVADLFVRKDRIYSKEVTGLAAGASTTIVHNRNTNLLMAQAWVKSSTDASWQPVGAATTPAELGSGQDGAFNATSDTTLAAKEWNFTSFSIAAGKTVTVTGSSPLIIRSQGPVVIAGTLTLAGGTGTNWSGPCPCSFTPGGAGGGGGGAAGGQGATNVSIGSAGQGPGGGGAGGMASQGGAGGGGGHVSVGQQGLAGNSSSCSFTAGALGVGGASYGSVEGSLLVAGSGGGGGGSGGGNDTSGGGGGGGGGAIKIVASTVEITGTLTADGGKGGSILNGPSGTASGAAGAGGGGGSGGAIWVVASNVVISGSVTARGGKGGDPFTANCHGGAGGDGANGRIRIDTSAITSTGTVAPAQFSAGAGLPPLNRARLHQPNANTLTLQNDGATPLDVKIVALIP